MKPFVFITHFKFLVLFRLVKKTTYSVRCSKWNTSNKLSLSSMDRQSALFRKYSTCMLCLVVSGQLKRKENSRLTKHLFYFIDTVHLYKQ